VFVSDDSLYVVDGNKLPPLIYKRNIENPDFDIVEEIRKQT